MNAWKKSNPRGFWVLPLDYEEADLAAGLLPSWKGSTPETLPELGPPTDDPPLGAYPICGGATPSEPHP